MKDFHCRTKTVFVAGVSLALFFLSLEVCARVEDRINYGAPLLGPYSVEKLRGTADGMPCNVPNVRFEKWRNNNLGFRGPDVAVEKPAAAVRVVCLGASETYGLFETPGKEWPAQLQELLAGDKRYQVINGAVVGLNLANYRGYLEKHLLPLKPDVVLICMNPLFYAVREVRRASGAAPRVATSKPAAAGSPSPSLGDTLRIVPKLKLALKQVLTQYLPDALKWYQVRKLQEEIRELEARRLKGGEPKETVPDAYVEHFASDLDALLAFAKSRGIRVVVMTYPSLISTDNIGDYPETFLDNRRFCIEYTLSGMVDIFDKFNGAVRRCALKQRVEVVDLDRRFPKSPLYFGDNVHYTDRGSRLVAELLAQAVRGSGGSQLAAAGGRK